MWYAAKYNQITNEPERVFVYQNAPPVFSDERIEQGWKQIDEEEFKQINLQQQLKRIENLQKIELKNEDDIQKDKESIFIVGEKNYDKEE